MVHASRGTRIESSDALLERASNDAGLARLPDRILLIATVLMVSVLRFVIPAEDARGAGSPMSQGLWTLLYLIAIVGLVAERRTASRLIRGSLPVVLIIVLAFCSTIWSEAPFETAKASLGLLGTSLLALYFACRFSPKSFIATLSFAIGITAVLSVVFIVFFPAAGLMPYGDPIWRGAFIHKNLLAEAMVFGLVTVVCQAGGSILAKPALRIATILLFLALLIGSKGIGSLVVAAALALLFLALIRSRSAGSVKPALLAAVVLSAGGIAAVMFGFGSDQIFDLLGKDESLTGRTEVWQLAINAIGERPFLGYGFDAFFNPDTATGQGIARLVPWDPNTAHNGYLEFTLGLGLVGAVVLARTFFVGLKRGWSLFWKATDYSSLWPLMVIIFVLLNSISEAGFARVNDIRWILFLTAFFFATNASQRRAMQSQAAGTTKSKTGHIQY